MNSFRKELWFETPGRRAFLNITPQVEVALKESEVQEGIALINAMHITASVFINDDEQGLHADYEAWLERLAPHEPVSGYRHNRTGEDNADAHMKRQIMGREVVVAITAGKTRLRSMGEDLLWRVRWRAPQARADQDHRQIAQNPTRRGEAARSFSSTHVGSAARDREQAVWLAVHRRPIGLASR